MAWKDLSNGERWGVAAVGVLGFVGGLAAENKFDFLDGSDKQEQQVAAPAPSTTVAPLGRITIGELSCVDRNMIVVVDSSTADAPSTPQAENSLQQAILTHVRRQGKPANINISEATSNMLVDRAAAAASITVTNRNNIPDGNYPVPESCTGPNTNW